MNMEYSDIQLTDLPDEILMTIFKQLNGAEILYSLIGVNKRLNKIVHDSNFTSMLTLLNYHLDGSISSLSYPMLDRFCSEILPEINHKIEWLNLELSSMARILLSTNYPNLFGLGLYDLEIEIAKYLFTDETLILRFKNQITSLVIDINESDYLDSAEILRLIFTRICVMFTNLEYLNFGVSLSGSKPLLFATSPPAVFSSTLRELHVSLYNFTSCLYLLDGHFNQIHTLNVRLTFIGSSCEIINNKKKLPNLRCFSLYNEIDTERYDDLIVPLLHRMVNLEKLDLQLGCEREIFIDGNDLKTNIINYLLQLNTFTFNIMLTNYSNNQINLPSNEDIQETFKDFKYNQVISCVDYFQDRRYSQCHVYSYPYKSIYYHKITNNFPGRLFECVRIVSLFDERPFEHEFFLRIQKSFPFMKKLDVTNCKAQKYKQCRKLGNENENFSIIEYRHLTELCLTKAHEDYLEEFLLDTNTCLPNGVCLLIDYRRLEEVTHYFKRDATRINCSKMNYFYNEDITDQLPKHFKDYFLHTDVVRF